jgi:hypothetical protein
MGLDQYAYVAAKEGQYDEFYETGKWDAVQQDYVGSTVSKPVEIAYWRKHPNLQGWMEQLWLNRLADQGKTPKESTWGSSFNGIELELTWEDLEQLELDINEGRLPETSGFFFGNDSGDYYKEQDLEFIKRARSEIFCGLRVFYNSSW